MINLSKITLSDKIKVHDDVRREIEAISIMDERLAARLMQRIAELGTDPSPNNKDCKAKIVESLALKGVFVKRLRCLDVEKYRIFYCIRKSGFICIYAVVFASGTEHHDEAYNEMSDHYLRIKLHYKFWRECQ